MLLHLECMLFKIRMLCTLTKLATTHLTTYSKLTINGCTFVHQCPGMALLLILGVLHIEFFPKGSFDLLGLKNVGIEKP